MKFDGGLDGNVSSPPTHSNYNYMSGAMLGGAGAPVAPPRFRLMHPHGFRLLKKSSVVERSMRNYFRLPDAPSDVIRHERQRVLRSLVQSESDERAEEARRIAGGSRGVALDGFLILNAAATDDPSHVDVVTLQSSRLVSSMPEDLAYFPHLLFLDVSENELQLEDLLMLEGLETLHMAYNKMQSLSGLDDVMQWQLEHQKSIIAEFRHDLTADGDEGISYEVLLPHLVALNLSYNQIPARELAFLSYFPFLQQLDLSGNNLKTLPDDIGLLQSVTHLALENNHFTSQTRQNEVDVFVALSTMPSLVEVNLNYNRISQVPPLVPVAECFFPKLEVVSLGHNPFTTPESVMELFSLHKTLRRVILVETPLAKDPSKSFKTQQLAESSVISAFLDAAAAPAEDGPTDSWQNESWFRLIAKRDDDPPLTTVTSAAASAAAAAAAERELQNSENKRVPHDPLHSTIDDTASSKVESEDRMPASPEEYLQWYYVELVFQEITVTKRKAREFLSASNSRKNLVTIPQHEEFMDIYRLAGAAKQRFRKRQEREKRSGPKPVELHIISKPVESSETEEDESESASEERHHAEPKEEGGDSVFLTAVDAEVTDGVQRDEKPASPHGRAPLKPILPSVCPVTTNVHGAMTELRALLRKPLPTLPYNTAHLTAVKKPSIRRR